MKLELVGPPDVAAALGLPDDKTGAPRRDAIGSMIRKYIAAKRAVGEDELAGLLVSLCVAAGFSADAAKSRIISVLRMLVSVGDVAALPGDNGLVLMAAAERYVSAGPDFSVRLGGAEDESDGDYIPEETVLRRVAPAPSACRLSDYLGAPDFRRVMTALGGSPETALTDMPALVGDIARLSGEPLNGAGHRRLFSLGNTNAYVALFGDKLAAVFAEVDGEDVKVLRLEPGETAGWLWLAMQGPSALREWPGEFEIPKQLLNSLILAAEPGDDNLRKWKISAPMEAELLAWLGLEAADGRDEPEDSSQDRVVFAPSDERLLVEAGPGSGKTWTLCRRASHLIEEGLEPARLLVISFTRAAVAEIRDRIGSCLEDPTAADAIRIITLDSLASAIRFGFAGDAGSPASYDANVAETLQLVRSGDDDLLEYIERIEHLFVDEAQDLTGDRRDLVLAILEKLDAATGATVFHDPAQSIYGFVAGERSGVEDRINEAASFSRVSLRKNYRTQSPSLIQLFTDLRAMLSESGAEPAERYEAVRTGIESAADAVAGSVRLQQVGPADGKTFFLFRTRGEVVAATAELLATGQPFRVRLPKNQAIVQPWVGAILRHAGGPFIDRSTFDGLWEEIRPLPVRSADSLWSVLFRIAGQSDGRLDLSRLAVRLSTDSPPPAVIQTDIGRSGGPLLATIHSAKGREADTIHLYLPRYPEETSRVDWMEEARILFVAATRARRSLRVGSAPTWLRAMDRPSRRLWQQRNWGGRHDGQIEVGLDGDVDLTSITTANTPQTFESEAEAQSLLWTLSSKTTELVAARQGDTYHLRVSSGRHGGQVIGRLSKSFTGDLQRLSELVSGSRQPLPGTIGRIYLTGVRTIAAHGQEGAAPAFRLAPVISGLPIIYLDRSN